MAEVVLPSETSNDELRIVEPEDRLYSGQDDSIIGLLPADGYLVFDVRPTVQSPTRTVSCLLSHFVLDVY